MKNEVVYEKLLNKFKEHIKFSVLYGRILLGEFDKYVVDIKLNSVNIKDDNGVMEFVIDYELENL